METLWWGGIQLNLVQSYVFASYKYLQVIRAVDWLRESVSFLQVKAQIIGIDFCVGLRT